MADRAPRRAAAAVLLAATLLGAGCRTMAPAGSTAAGPLAGLAAADLGTQHLFHLHGRRDGSDLRLRLTLRIWSAQEFDLAASDPFGRTLWRLTAAPGSGEWRDLRAGHACRFDPAATLRLPGFAAPFAVAELPALLLGRLPVEAPAAIAARRPASFAFVDARGWNWKGTTRGGELESWTVVANDAALPLGRARAQRSGDQVRLVLADPPIELEWRAATHAPLPPSAARPFAPPADLAPCTDADFS